jgi:hypothetical protein
VHNQSEERWLTYAAAAVLVVVMSVSVGARASGAFMDGNDLYGFCASSGSFQQCSGYIEAIADAYNPINAYTAFEPPSVPIGQAVDVSTSTCRNLATISSGL